jgi:hypothetical protein
MSVVVCVLFMFTGIRHIFCNRAFPFANLNFESVAIDGNLVHDKARVKIMLLLGTP